MSDEELQQMDKEELLGIIKAQHYEISILKDDKEHLGEFLKEKEDEIERLQEKINQYENPDDMTLMFMWCDEKVKDKIKQLHSIIKEVREYIENNSLYEQDYDYDYEENLYEYPPSDEQAKKDLLDILKGSDKE